MLLQAILLSIPLDLDSFKHLISDCTHQLSTHVGKTSAIYQTLLAEV